MPDNSPSSKTRLEILQARAQMYQHVRAFFTKKGVLEVETPIFSVAGNTDPSIQSLRADFRPFSGGGESTLRYAHTSPEFAMKRLLTEGVGPIYQICKVFRVGETGRLHNPEFSMLEWYRPGLNYAQLMLEVEELMRELGVNGQFHRISYNDLFDRFLNLDVKNANSEQLAICAKLHKLDVVGMTSDYDDWCNLLLSHLIEPKLKRLGAVFVYDYPASQAALANIRHDENGVVAERFELYLQGIEVANGYQELTDSMEYKRRFHFENTLRKKRGLDEVEIDDKLLTALNGGFPASAGVALGLDRLLMYLLDLRQIKDVLSIDFQNA